VSLLEADAKDDSLVGHCADLIDCLRLLHAIAEREQKVDDAQSIARRIQRLLGEKDGIDEIDRVLATYANLPDHFDLAVNPDGVDLITDDFSKGCKRILWFRPRKILCRRLCSGTRSNGRAKS